jgi:hypothetical protein
MKRTVLFLGAVVLAIPAPLALPSPANAQISPGQGAPEACQTFVLPFDPTSNLGECVAFVNTFWRSPEHGSIVMLCDAVREIAPAYFFSVYDSHSECVRDEAQEFDF